MITAVEIEACRDSRLEQDVTQREGFATLLDNMGWDKREHDQHVAIASFVLSNGTWYQLGNSGQFVDRFFALAFMDENPDMFPQREDRAYALVLVTTQSTAVRSFTVL